MNRPIREKILLGSLMGAGLVSTFSRNLEDCESKGNYHAMTFSFTLLSWLQGFTSLFSQAEDLNWISRVLTDYSKKCWSLGWNHCSLRSNPQIVFRKVNEKVWLWHGFYTFGSTIFNRGIGHRRRGDWKWFLQVERFNSTTQGGKRMNKGRCFAK